MAATAFTTPATMEPMSELYPTIKRPRSSRSDSHQEHHTDHGEITRDIIIGFADGLTVPFALTAGLSSLGSSRLVIIGGLAELFSGSISMGLGAYLAAVTERDHYFAEEKREKDEVAQRPEDEKQEIHEILERYGIGRDARDLVVQDLVRSPTYWVQFMMDFELKLEKPNVSRAWISAGTMGAAYFIGGLVPMIPYFAVKNVTYALFISISITVCILLAFGYVKDWVTVRSKRAGFRGAIQTLSVGVIAAGASYGIVKAIDSISPVQA